MSSTGMGFARLAPEADKVHAHAMVPHTRLREAKTALRYVKLTPPIKALLYTATYIRQQISSATFHVVRPYDRSVSLLVMIRASGGLVACKFA